MIFQSSFWTLAASKMKARGSLLYEELIGRAGSRLYLLSGMLRGKLPIAARFLGRESRLQEINTMLFMGAADIVEGHERARKTSFDLEIAEAWPWSTTRGDCLVVQPWLASIGTTSGDYERYLSERVSASMVRKVRNARALGLTFRVSSGREEDRFFYDQMVVPLVAHRHGGAAALSSFDHFVRWNGRHFRTEVIFLEHQGKSIAGIALVIPRTHGDVLLQWCGALPAVLEDKKLRKEFTLLLNDYAFRLACAAGRNLNLGNNRPFLDDGVFNFKRQWGCALETSPRSPRFAIRIRAASKHQVLACAPIFHLASDGIRGLAALPQSPDLPDEVVRQLRPAIFPELKGMTVVGDEGALTEPVRHVIEQRLGCSLSFQTASA